VIRATLDTNLLVSGLALLTVPTSTPGAVFWHWLAGTFELVISADIMAELQRTLTKPYYLSRRSPEQIEATERLFTGATIIEPTIAVSGVATHPEDDLVLAVVVSADVDYLVTGDKALQRLGAYRGIRILSPREFLDLLKANGDQQP
jgi:predicted nucleic acid-binding protein